MDVLPFAYFWPFVVSFLGFSERGAFVLCAAVLASEGNFVLHKPKHLGSRIEILKYLLLILLY